MLVKEKDILSYYFYSLTIFISMWYFQPLVHVDDLYSCTVLETRIKSIHFQKGNWLFSLVWVSFNKVRLSIWNQKNGIASISKFSSERDLNRGRGSPAMLLLCVELWLAICCIYSWVNRILEQCWDTELYF